MTATALLVVALAVLGVGAAFAAMALGVIVRRRPCLRGSCGGIGASDERTPSCDTCPHRRARR